MTTLPAELRLQDLELILGRDRDWILARAGQLPCRLTPAGMPVVRREDLKAWIEAAREQRQERCAQPVALGWPSPQAGSSR